MRLRFRNQCNISSTKVNETLKTMDFDAILNRKLTTLFSSETIRAQAIVILETYGTEKHEQ